MSKTLNKLSHNERFLIDILFNQERKTITNIAKILIDLNQQYQEKLKEIHLMVITIMK